MKCPTRAIGQNAALVGHIASALCWRRLGVLLYARPAALSGRPRRAAHPLAIPVITAEVRRTDVPILLTGLGTVQALNSVLIKSRVDGQIKKINFVEGQDVRAGDVLVEIDPEPYQAALNQAQANKLRDEAMLENARLDLTRFSRLATTGAATIQQLDTARAQVKQLEASIQSDQAAIYSAQVQLDYSRIRSPLERPRRHPPDRCRQHGEGNRHRRHRDHQPARPDLRHLPTAIGYSAVDPRCHGARRR